MIAWLKSAAIGAVVGALAGFGGGWRLRDLAADAAELRRQQAEARQAHRRAEAAAGAASDYEGWRDDIRQRLRAPQPRYDAALASAPVCPPPGAATAALGDLLLPDGALDRVRAAAGEPAGHADTAEPRPAMRRGTADPGG